MLSMTSIYSIQHAPNPLENIPILKYNNEISPSTMKIGLLFIVAIVTFITIYRTKFFTRFNNK